MKVIFESSRFANAGMVKLSNQFRQSTCHLGIGAGAGPGTLVGYRTLHSIAATGKSGNCWGFRTMVINDSGMIVIRIPAEGDHRFRRDRDQFIAISGTVITMPRNDFHGGSGAGHHRRQAESPKVRRETACQPGDRPCAGSRKSYV